MDNEIKGEGNSINFTYRMHDPRVGRFFAPDPLAHKYPFYSSYQDQTEGVLGTWNHMGFVKENFKEWKPK